MSHDPQAELRAKFAEIAQRGYEDSLTPQGRVAHAEYLGQRIATDLMELFDEVEVAREYRRPGFVLPVGDGTSVPAAAATHTRLVLRTAPEPITEGDPT